jgi:hypothetical protein
MTDATRKLSIEEKLVFAISPQGQGDGVPLLIVGLPALAWEYMKDGKTHHFDLTKIGLPVKMIFFGAENHDAAMKAIDAGMKARGEAYLDERQQDFSIEPKPAPGKITRDPEFPAEDAQLVVAFNRCADGYRSRSVLSASVQILAAAIGVLAKAQGASQEQTIAYAEHVGGCVIESVRSNWQREGTSSDIEVKLS